MGKGRNNKRKLNTLPEISGTISSGVSVVVDVFFGITGLQFGMLNIVIFAFAVVVLLVIWIWLTISFCKNMEVNRESCELQKESFLDYIDANIDLKKYHSGIERIKKDYNQKQKRERKFYICVTILLAVGLVANICMAVSQYSVMSGSKEIDDAAGTNIGSSVNTTTVKTTVVNDGDANKGITPEQKAEMENQTFILSNPKKLEVLLKEDEERVFYVSPDEDEPKQKVDAHLNGILCQAKRSTILKDSLEESVAEEAQSEEDAFLGDIKKARNYRTQENYEGWKSVIPDSDTLTGIMDDREKLLESLYEGMEVDGVLCIRMANSHQLMADEYRLQGGKPQTVVYHYVEAIKWTEEGLAYEDLPKGYRSDYVTYLKARYKDIADYIANNLERFGNEKEKYEQIMKKANVIYETM